MCVCTHTHTCVCVCMCVLQSHLILDYEKGFNTLSFIYINKFKFGEVVFRNLLLTYVYT